MTQKPQRIWIVPVAGRLVRDPKTMRPIPSTGALVVDGQHWRRRERDGDIMVAGGPIPAAVNGADVVRRGGEGGGA